MKKIAVLTTLVAVALVALVAPVQAKNPNAHGPKCTPKAHKYKVRGTLVSGSLTKEADGTYSGDLTVHITKADHGYKSEKDTDQSYTLDHAKVHIHKGAGDASALTAGDKVKLDGTRTRLNKKCDQTGFTPVTVIKRGNIHKPANPKSGHAARPKVVHSA